MKNLLFTLFFAFSATAAFSQATFQLLPDSAWATAAVDINPVEAHNSVKNLTNTTLDIKWERTVISVDPDTLLTQVCDINACYTPPVGFRSFQLGPGATGGMSVYLLNNSGGPASALVHLKFTDLGNPGNVLTGVYVFDASLTGTNEQLPLANVALFPNPVVESFSLKNADEVGRVRVYALDGRRVATFDAAYGNNAYSLAGQPAGTYVVALESKTGKIFQAIEIVKN